MIWIYIIIIIILLLVVLILSLSLFFFIKKSDFIHEKDKEFIEFVIDMYIQYAEDLEIHSKAQHKKITEKLEKIKNKHFINNKKQWDLKKKLKKLLTNIRKKMVVIHLILF